MKLNFCTLFNSNYLSRGLVMYESLLKNCHDFHLYIFAFDDKSYEFLKNGSYPHLTVISLKEFEDSELLRIKPTRTAAEYCWTCTASTILYSIKTFGLDNCTYIDADMRFYSDPSVLINEMGENSVLITEHRYTKEHDQSATSGKYCVQFVTFKNDPRGMTVLNWWRNACIDWCYDRMEDGKFGDQKYLDDWTTRFEGVHELKHPGGGIAPWNVQQYTFEEKGNEITGTEISTGKTFKAVFFHFHGLKLYRNRMVMLTGMEYGLSREVKKIFYEPYVKELEKAKLEINSKDASFDPHGATSDSPRPALTLWMVLIYYLKDLKSSVKNIFGKKLKYRIQHHYFYNTDDFKL
ncbi:MAG: glycosyl transferase [Bacteroidia bacterium]